MDPVPESNWIYVGNVAPVLVSEFTIVLRGPESNRRLEVMLTTTTFVALSVCSLDYVFTHMGCLPSSLYTFSPLGELGSALPCIKRGFHRIWQMIFRKITLTDARIVQASRGTSPLPRDPIYTSICNLEQGENMHCGT